MAKSVLPVLARRFFCGQRYVSELEVVRVRTKLPTSTNELRPIRWDSHGTHVLEWEAIRKVKPREFAIGLLMMGINYQRFLDYLQTQLTQQIPTQR
jgi:hypothetical protein